MPELRVETEMPLSTVTFPPVLDHSWSFTTSAVHARPQELFADGRVEDGCAVLERLEEGAFGLTPRADARWTDGRPVTVAELHVAVSRALSLSGGGRRVSAEGAGPMIVLRTTMDILCLREFLASALFSLTPCVRATPERHTSGAFAIRDIRRRGRVLELRRRDVGEDVDVEALELIATNSTSEGLSMLAAGDLDLTRVLGGVVTESSAGLNALVGTVMGLRSAPGGEVLRTWVTELLDLDALAEATGGAYVVASGETSSPTASGRAEHEPELRSIAYADFYPNSEVVTAVLDQLRSGTSVACPVAYSDYLVGDVPPGSLRLDLIDSLFGSGAGFSALLQARTTLNAGHRVAVAGPVVTRRAEIEWAAVRMEESWTTED